MSYSSSAYDDAAPVVGVPSSAIMPLSFSTTSCVGLISRLAAIPPPIIESSAPVAAACAFMKRCICGDMPHCGCTRADGDLVSRVETETLSTRPPRTVLRYSVVALRLSVAFSSASFSSSDISPSSAFSLAASTTS